MRSGKGFFQILNRIRNQVLLSKEAVVHVYPPGENMINPLNVFDWLVTMMRSRRGCLISRLAHSVDSSLRLKNVKMKKWRRKVEIIPAPPFLDFCLLLLEEKKHLSRIDRYGSGVFLFCD